MRLSERRLSIGSCNPEEQVELFLEAAYEFHPPDIESLSEEVAAGGAQVAPAVVSRVEHLEVWDQYQALSLLFILVRMQDGGYWQVRRDAQLIQRLESAVVSLHGPATRSSAQEVLRWIKEPEAPR